MILTALLTLTVIIGPVPVTTPASFPVQDIIGPVQDLTFPVASLDGAVTDTGERDFRLNSDVLFAFDKSDLTPRAQREITRIAGLLRTPPAGQPAVTRVQVSGYTDSKGSDDYNLGLSRRRAEAVRAALAQALAGSRITLTATGFGEKRPIAPNTTKPGQALNRRVEIRGS